MLLHLTIRNYTIIDELEISFNQGLTTLTGETGAGKSILIDALSLIAGSRADSQVIRKNENRCELTAVFSINSLSNVRGWLQQQAIEVEDQCILRRVIQRDGRSLAFINGQATTLQQLRSIAIELLSLHGQHEQQALMNNDFQRQLVDAFAKQKELSSKVNHIYRQWKQQYDEYQQLLNKQENQAEKALLEYQIQELEELALTPDEVVQLENEHKRLNNAEDLIHSCQMVATALDSHSDGAIIDSLHQYLDKLTPFLKLDARIKNIHELLNNATIYLKEAGGELHDYIDQVEMDPARLATIELRLSAIHDIARKHHISSHELASFSHQLREHLAVFTQSSEQLAKIKKNIESLEKEYQQLANKLSQQRALAVPKLNNFVSIQIQKLGMKGGELMIALTPYNDDKPHPFGQEAIEFLVRTNPGQDFHPLAKVASGGELSRIALAIDVITAQTHTIPTIIFDEIDAGIGGSIAAIVGQLLKQLAKDGQVLCVTHLPQVAAFADQHYLVGKKVNKTSTSTSIKTLTHAEKINEIARMLSGLEITKQTLAHAEEMLASAHE